MFHLIYEKLLERRILRAEERIPSHILLVLNEVDILSVKRRRGIAAAVRLCADSDSSDGAEKLRKFVKWCMSLGVNEVSIYVSLINDECCKDACRRVVERVIWALSVYNNYVIYTPCSVPIRSSSLSSQSSSPSSQSLSSSSSLFPSSYAISSHSPSELDSQSLSYSQSSYPDSSSTAPSSLSLLSKKEDAEFRITVSVGFGGRSELTNAFRRIAENVQSGIIEPADIDEKMIEDALIFRSEPDLIIRSGCANLTDFLIWQSVYSELYFTDVNWHNFRRIDLLRAIRDFQTRERRFGR